MTPFPTLSHELGVSPEPPSTALSDIASTVRFDAGDDRTARVVSIARKFGCDVLQDVEVLELHLARAGVADAGAAAEVLIARFGGLTAVLAADRTELLRHVHDEAAFALKLLRETSNRLAAARLPRRCLLSSSSAVQAYLRCVMAALPREEFWVVYLDRGNQLLLAERQSQGTVDHAPVYPREVIRRALEVGASAMILAHNHPSGDPTPSRPDLEMTKAIMAAAKVLSITVWDHMIVGRDKVLSLRAEGLM